MFIFSYSISITALTHFLKSHNDSTVSTTINRSLIEMSATLYLLFNFFASFLGVHLYRNNHAAGFGCLIHNLIGLLQANQLEIMSKYCHQIALLFIFLTRKCQSVILNLVFQFPFSGFIKRHRARVRTSLVHTIQANSPSLQLHYCHGAVKISFTGLTGQRQLILEE